MRRLIIIPAYNEAEDIEKTVGAIIDSKVDFDYIIINDCSTGWINQPALYRQRYKGNFGSGGQESEDGEDKKV